MRRLGKSTRQYVLTDVLPVEPVARPKIEDGDDDAVRTKEGMKKFGKAVSSAVTSSRGKRAVETSGLAEVTWGAVADAEVVPDDDDDVKKGKKTDDPTGIDSDDEKAAIAEEKRVKALLESQWGIEEEDQGDEYYDRTEQGARKRARKILQTKGMIHDDADDVRKCDV